MADKSSLTERCSAVVGQPVLAHVEIRTEALQASQRSVNVWRAMAFAAGFGLAALLGIGWVLIAVGAVVHYLAFRRRDHLVATDDGLVALHTRRGSDAVTQRWAAGQRVDLLLRTGEPDVTVRIDGWTALVSGVDLSDAEATIRAAGSEPLRVVERG